MPTADTQDLSVFKSPVLEPDVAVDDGTSPPMSRAQLCQAQRADPTLAGCFEKVEDNGKASGKRVNYYIDDGLLMRRWSLSVAADEEWCAVHQIVAPVGYRRHVLAMAHDSDWSGHLEVSKTYQLVLKHFFFART